MFEHAEEMYEIQDQLKELTKRKKEIMFGNEEDISESAIEYAGQYIKEAGRFVSNIELAQVTGTHASVWSSALRQVKNGDLPYKNYRYVRGCVAKYYIACDVDGSPLPEAHPISKPRRIFGWIYTNNERKA